MLRGVHLGMSRPVRPSRVPSSSNQGGTSRVLAEPELPGQHSARGGEGREVHSSADAAAKLRSDQRQVMAGQSRRMQAAAEHQRLVEQAERTAQQESRSGGLLGLVNRWLDKRVR